MLTRRLTSAFLIALAISGVFTYWLSQKTGGKNQPAAPKSQVVAAAANLEAGQALRADNLRLVEWPASMPLQGGFPSMESVVGRVVLYPLSAGEPVLERQLAAPGSGTGLTVKIPEGMRAISLRTDEVVGVAGFLLPGSHVDVLVTLRTANTPEPVTSSVLQDVEILAAGQKTQPDPEGKATVSTVVTLLVKPEDAERLVLASTQGTLHFVLRNGSDRDSVAGQPVQLSQLAGTPVAPVHVVDKTPRKRLVVEPINKPYVVETVSGGKQRTDNF